jgi:hypothetical protein
MVKVMVELSETQIQMLVHCIEGALDTKHLPKEEEGGVKEILEQLSKHL